MNEQQLLDLMWMMRKLHGKSIGKGTIEEWFDVSEWQARLTLHKLREKKLVVLEARGYKSKWIITKPGMKLARKNSKTVPFLVFLDKKQDMPKVKQFLDKARKTHPDSKESSVPVVAVKEGLRTIVRKYVDHKTRK